MTATKSVAANTLTYAGKEKKAGELIFVIIPLPSFLGLKTSEG